MGHGQKGDQDADENGEHLDAKLPPPAKVVGHGTAESSAKSRTDAVGDVEVGLVLASCLNGHHVTDDDTPQRHHASGAEAARGSGKDEACHARGRGTPHVGHGKDEHGDQVGRFPSHRVRDASQQGLEAGRGEQEGGREPGRAVGGVEVGGDDGVARGHDGAVEAGDEVQRQDHAEDAPEAAGADAVQVGGCFGIVVAVREEGVAVIVLGVEVGGRRSVLVVSTIRNMVND